MTSLERCRIILGLSSDNQAKLDLLQVFLDKARLDIEAFCRDTFLEYEYDEEGNVLSSTDNFPSQLSSVQEDLTIYRFRKRGAEGQNSYSLADESVTFEDYIPMNIEKRLYPYRQLFARE